MSKTRSGAPRRVAAGLLAGALTVFGLALAAPAGAVDSVSNDRVAGADRFGTAAAACTEAYQEGTDNVIIATARDFPDALAASGLAGANAACILLTEIDQLPEASVAAIQDLGASNAIIVGGTAAVSQDVEDFLNDEVGVTTSRVAGDDRFETAGEIASAIGTAGELEGDGPTAILASGRSSADALAAGSIAAAGDGTNQVPILLTEQNDLPAATIAAIDELGITNIIVVGGTGVISEAVRDEAGAAAGDDDVTVLAGTDRNKTAVAIAEFAVTELGWGPETVCLANSRKPPDAEGADFGPDALSGGPLCGLRQAPILLVESVGVLGADTEAFLDAHSDTITELLILGGTAAISDIAEGEAVAAAQNTSNDAPTGGDTQTAALVGPELQSCSISGIDIDDLAITYTYVFDAELDEDVLNPELFKLYNADTRNPALGDVFNDGDELEIDGDSANVTFNLANYAVTNATLCAAAEGAVEDEDGNVNPAQSVGTSGVSNSAGVGLVSVTIVDAEDGTVDYVFGSPQIPGLSHRGLEYSLIDRDGTVFSVNDATTADASSTHPDADEPSTTVRVEFGVDLSDENIRRGVARSQTQTLAGTAVTAANFRINDAVVAGGGTTDAPDLVQIQVASDNDDLEDNEALFIFDEAIDTVSTDLADAVLWDLVYSHCDPGAATVGGINSLITTFNALFPGEDYDAQDGEGFDDDVQLGSTCAISPQSVDLGANDDDEFNNRSVLLTFATDDIDNDFLIAGQVAEGAEVSEAGDGDLSNNDNEVEYSAQPSSVYNDGDVYGPQLVSAGVEVDTTFGGDFRDWTLTLTFDQAIDDDTALAGTISYWYEDGGNVESDDFDLADCDYDGTTSVECTIDDEDSTFADAVVVSVSAGVVQSNATYDIDNDETGEQFPNPEASIEIDVPEAPEA